MDEHSYDEGVRDGRIQSLESIVKQHAEKFDHHENRLRIMERILYGLIGAFALIQFIPTLEKIF